MSRHWVLSGVLVLVGIAGCGGAGDEVDRVVVTGKVTKGGQPLRKGRITFYPVEATKGPTSGAEIKEGEYRAEAKGGVPIGTHRVEVHEFELKQAIPGRPPALDVEQNILPEQFNTNSTARLTVEPGSKELVKNFNLDEDFGPPE